jgi:hypothetical protein
MEEMTQEQIQGSVRAAFDSVNLINEQILLPLTDETSDLVDRNYRHLQVMLSKDWFSEALTTEERDAIDQSISDSLTYLNI